MRSLISFFVLLLTLLTVFGCSEKKQVADYKRYFSPTALDGTTRYYVFSEQTTVEGKTYYAKAVRKAEKLNDSLLVLVEYTCYSDTCFRADSTIMVLREDGAYNKESYVGRPEGWQALDLTSKTVVIPWSWEEGREVNLNWKFQQEGAPAVSLKTKRKFVGFEKVDVEGEMMTAAVRKDVQTRTIGDKKIHTEVTIWDLPTFGLYRYESKSDDRDYLMVFREEINEIDYNLLLGR